MNKADYDSKVEKLIEIRQTSVNPLIIHYCDYFFNIGNEKILSTEIVLKASFEEWKSLPKAEKNYYVYQARENSMVKVLTNAPENADEIDLEIKFGLLRLGFSIDIPCNVDDEDDEKEEELLK